MRRKILSIAAMILTLVFSAAALAAIPGINNSRYIKMYVLSSGNDTPVYTDAHLNQRGTSNPYRAYNATIYANDEIWVLAMNDSIALISYPTSSGRRQGYVRTNALTSNNYSQSVRKARSQLTNIYARPGVRYSGSSISNGDDVWTVARQGNYTQVVYPTGNTYKMAWITNSDYDNYIAPQNNRSGGGSQLIIVEPVNPASQISVGGRYRTISDGWYRIQPMHELGHSADALGNQYRNGNNIHLWDNIDCDQQKFYLQNRGNGYFSLQSGYGNRLFVTADGNGNGANLYTSPWNGSDSQLFRLVDAGNNSYHVFSKVGNNLNFDSAGAGRGNGTNVQLWTSENNDWHKWRFTGVTAPSVNHDPQGTNISVDSPAPNTLHVKGTAFDEDNPNASVRVHVYVGGTPGSSVPQYEIRTNGSNRVFEDTRTIDRNYTGRQLVHIYALNDHGAGNNVEIWNGYVDIKAQVSHQYVYPLDGHYKITTMFYYEGIQRALKARHSVWWHKPVSEGGHFNSLDISCNGNTNVKVKAVADGRVINDPEAGYAGSSGIVVIEHPNAPMIGKSLYAHLSDIWVKPGDKVSAGQIIGIAGDKGIGGGNYHLHLEWYNSSPWEYYREKVPFLYCRSTKKVYENKTQTYNPTHNVVLPEDKQRFGEAIRWVENYPKNNGGFIH